MGKIISVPVVWEMCGMVEIEANNMHDAMEVFKNDKSISIPLGEIINGSFQLADVDIGQMNIWSKAVENGESLHKLLEE